MGAARTSSSQGAIRFGPFELRPLTGELRKDGVKIKISGQPLEILLVLLVRAGEVVSRDELRDSLWRSDTFVDFEHSLNAAVKRLRIALDDDVASPRYIETVPRRGYRFIGEIKEDAIVSNSMIEMRAEATRVEPITVLAKRATSSSQHWIVILAALFFAAGLLWAKVLATMVR